MKERISATVEPRTLQLVEELVKKFRYRNQSHVIEEGIRLLMEEHNDKNKK